TASSDDTSYLTRTSSGSLSIRTNIVGTTWVWVAPNFSIAARYSSASKFGMTTSVPPSDWVATQKRNGAAWYSGAGDRYTLVSSTPNSSCISIVTPVTRSSSGLASNAGSTPFGRPVVPDEYSMSTPATRSGSGVGSCWATASS